LSLEFPAYFLVIHFLFLIIDFALIAICKGCSEMVRESCSIERQRILLAPKGHFICAYLLWGLTVFGGDGDYGDLEKGRRRR